MTELGFVATTVAGQNWSENAAESLEGPRRSDLGAQRPDRPREHGSSDRACSSPVAKSIKVVRLTGPAPSRRHQGLAERRAHQGGLDRRGRGHAGHRDQVAAQLRSPERTEAASVGDPKSRTQSQT